jgi:hypothetical protein
MSKTNPFAHVDIPYEFREFREFAKEKKPLIREYSRSRATVRKLRRLADKAERSKPRAQRPHLPQHTEDDEAEISRLVSRVKELWKRRLERDEAEWADVRASPTALRHLAEALEEKLRPEWEERERKKREREAEREQRKAQFEELFPQLRRRGARHTLGVSPTATRAEITAAYRRLVKRLHPDANSGSRTGEKQLREVLAAYRALSREWGGTP